jgi:anaerobic ribonucleoside-triphosphate reductase
MQRKILLARAKVGISVGGGGFDTARFWEILANNCLLLTESIDIYQSDSKELNYKRVYQFKNLYDFKNQLEKVAGLLRNGYDQLSLMPEYLKILEEHSAKHRVETILEQAREKKLIN